MFEATATGPIGPRLMALASATGQLSPAAVKLIGGMLNRLDVLVDREAARSAALQVAIAALSAEWAGRVKLSTHRMTQLLAAHLNRFESPAYARILAGKRECQDELEFALFALLENPGPRCLSKLTPQVAAVFLPERRGK